MPQIVTAPLIAPSSWARRAKVAVACLAVLAVLRAFVAEAASGASVDAQPTWGTASASSGRSQMVWALAESGGRVYLGGAFTKLVKPGGGTLTRNKLAALDVETGDVLPWNPNVSGTVRDMVVSPEGTKLYIAGDFSRVGGQTARKVARLDVATGRIDPGFRPDIGGRARALALHGNRLYVGGDFTSVGGVPRPKLAALDATTGALLPWTPPTMGGGRYLGQTGDPTPDAESGNVYSLAVPADGSRVYVAGNFLDFGGQGGLLAVDAVTGQALPQQWVVDKPVFDVTMWPGDGWTLFAATGGAGGRLLAFRPDKPNRPLWKAKVDGDAMGVAASTTTVFLAGHYDFIVSKDSSCYQYCPKGLKRRHLAAFDATTGAPDPWNPTADTSTGPYVAAVGARHVYAGGEFNTINGRGQPGFAQFAMAPPPPVSTTTSSSSSSSITTPTTTDDTTPTTTDDTTPTTDDTTPTTDDTTPTTTPPTDDTAPPTGGTTDDATHTTAGSATPTTATASTTPTTASAHPSCNFLCWPQPGTAR
jgi:hypothetical protein